MMTSHATPRASNGYSGIAPKRMNGVVSQTVRSQAHRYAELSLVKRKVLRYFDDNYKRIFGFYSERNKERCRERVALMFIDMGRTALDKVQQQLDSSPDELIVILVGKLAWK